MNRRQAFSMMHDPQLSIPMSRLTISNIQGENFQTINYLVPELSEEILDAAANGCDGTHEDFAWRVLNRRGAE